MPVILAIGLERVHCQIFLYLINAGLLTEALALTAVLTTSLTLEVIALADGVSLIVTMMEKCEI